MLFLLAPSQPVSNLEGFSLTSTSIQLIWNSIPSDNLNGELLGYSIYVHNDTTSNVKGERVLNTTDLIATVDNLGIGTMYLFFVCAYNSAGDGPCARTTQKTLQSSKSKLFKTISRPP